jgi:hypothetical protein
MQLGILTSIMAAIGWGRNSPPVAAIQTVVPQSYTSARTGSGKHSWSRHAGAFGRSRYVRAGQW